jgi:hypothetical protein
MKRIAALAFYGIGALAILYLALSAYAALTGRRLQPGDPIHIFRKPDAPDYSAATSIAWSRDDRVALVITPPPRRGDSRRRLQA